jgi:hypothetical protein
MKDLVDQDFFSGIRFFRVIQNFMAQFGISGSRPPSFSFLNTSQMLFIHSSFLSASISICWSRVPALGAAVGS